MASQYSASPSSESSLSPLGDTPGRQDVVDNWDTSSVEQDLDEDMYTDDDPCEETVMDEDEDGDGNEDEDEMNQQLECDDASPPQTGAPCRTPPTPGSYDCLPESEAENTAPTLQQRMKELEDEQAALDRKKKALQRDVAINIARVSHEVYEDVFKGLATLKETLNEKYRMIGDCPDQPFPLPFNATTAQASASAHRKHVSKRDYQMFLQALLQCVGSIGKSMEGPEEMGAMSMALFEVANRTDYNLLLPVQQSNAMPDANHDSTGLTVQLDCIQTFGSFCGQGNQVIGNVPDLTGTPDPLLSFFSPPNTTSMGGNGQGDGTNIPDPFGIDVGMDQGNMDNGNILVNVPGFGTFGPISSWAT